MTCADYLVYNDAEIINTARAFAYTRQYGRPLDCNGCNPSGGVYTSPAADDAPWYDPVVPESADVLGYSGVVMEGVRKAAVTRSMLDLANGGGRPGPTLAPPRTLRIEVLAWARTECALSYAVAWLSAALSQPACGPGSCVGGTATIPVCCSDGPTDNGLRELYDVVLAEGPEEVVSRGMTCGVYFAHLELIVQAGQPWLYRTTMAGLTTLDLSASAPGTYTPSDTTAICNPYSGCLFDPGCELPPIPPAQINALDPCWSDDPVTGPYEMLPFEQTDFPSFLTAVPVISVEVPPGAGPSTERLFIRLLERGPEGCPDTPTDPCLLLAEWSVMNMGPGSRVTFDGRLRKAVAQCLPVYPTEFTPLVYGVQGGPPLWPPLTCGLGVCVEIAAEVAAPGTTVTIGWAIREDLA